MSSAVTTAAPQGKRVAIVQSNYIPWKGYFDLIAAVDEFILLDDVQYTKRDWRNRNLIKTAQGAQWLTIPVANKGRQMQLIDETEVSEPWAEQHWARIRHSYGKAPFFGTYESPLAGLYEAAAGLKQLSDINRLFLEGLCKLLNIGTPLVRSRDYASTGCKTEKLLTFRQSASAASYFRGLGGIIWTRLLASRHRRCLDGLWRLSRLSAALWRVRPLCLGHRPPVQYRPGGPAPHEVPDGA
jgi:hypothetical protein